MPNATQISDNTNGPDSTNPSFITVEGWSRGGPNTWVQGLSGSTILHGPAVGVNNGLGPSPDGGNYLAVDGASSFRSSASQTITGLDVGHTYRLSFYAGAGQQVGVPVADLTDHFDVTFGGRTKSSATYTTSDFGFSGWHPETLDFVADTSTQVLSFLAVGSPNLPPYMVLDGVSLVDVAAVPEPSSLILAGSAALSLALAYLRRRARFKAAA